LIYRGNYADWINPIWREMVLTTEGQARPRDWPPETAIESAEYSKAQNAGYDLTAVNWWVYEKKDLAIEINPPWCTGKVSWWITKLMPGQFMPMHTDPFTHYDACKRYWVPLQNYEYGHLFVYRNIVLTTYNTGDVYEYVNSQDIHGAANIGHTPRVVLQVTEHV
jgi:hypothetical protein